MADNARYFPGLSARADNRQLMRKQTAPETLVMRESVPSRLAAVQ